MSQSAIGVLDSGVGGLSVARQIAQLLPNESLQYFADNRHAPYGDKSVSYITQRVLKGAEFLLDQGAKAVVVACNTATSAAVGELREKTQVPVVAIEPAIKPAIALSSRGIVGVLATRQTIEGANIRRLVRQFAGDSQVLLKACPGLMEQVEAGNFDSQETLHLLHQFIDPLLAEGADTLVLGCTHYPFLTPVIQEQFGTEIRLLDPADAVAAHLRSRLMDTNLLNGDGGGGLSCFVSGSVMPFEQTARRLWQGEFSVESVSV